MAIKVVFLKGRAGYRGGLEKYTRHLMQAFVERGCSVILLTTGDVPNLPGIDVISLCPDSKFTLYQLLRFDALCKRWLKHHPADIVFGMERTTAQTHYRAGNGVHAVYLKQRRMIDSLWKRFTLHFNPLHHTLLHLEKQCFESPKLKTLFTNSSMVKEEILSHYNVPAQKIEVVHNGVEWHVWQSEFEKTFTSPRAKHKHHFLFIGNGYKRKGLQFLLKGLALHNRRPFHLTVVGKEKDPSYFVRLADELGLKEKITFAGSQTDILPFYREADTLVIPSIYDPFANVTVEALAMGLFVVSSRYNGGTEVIQEGSGIIIDTLTSPQSVAAALEKAFDAPKTEERARKIRQSVKELDFSRQLDIIVRSTL